MREVENAGGGCEGRMVDDARDGGWMRGGIRGRWVDAREEGKKRGEDGVMRGRKVDPTVR